MPARPDKRVPRVLYVAGPGEQDTDSVSGDLAWLHPDLEHKAVVGGAAALTELQSGSDFAAVVLGPNLSIQDSSAIVAGVGSSKVRIIKLFGETDHELLAAERGIEELRAERDRLFEAQGFERAMRERDRAALVSLQQTLAEERKRSSVLETTLRRTEDEARAQGRDVEAIEGEARQSFEDQLTAAADRLHAIASQTQLLQTELEQQVAGQAVDRDRLSEQTLFGYAVFTREGVLLRCSPSFAQMFGYATPDAAVESSRGRAFPRLPDHVRVIDLLESGTAIERAPSTARRFDGEPFRTLISAAFLGRGTSLVERLFVDVSELARLEADLRLARRLEAAGRLAAEMAPEIETLLPQPGDERISHDRLSRAVTLVQHLLSYSRRQAKPAGFLSLPDAIRRSEALLRPIAGAGIELKLSLGDVDAIAASEDDIEHLLVELVFASAALLPSGGTVTLETVSVTTDLVLNTQVSAIAAGYGVLPVTASTSLVRTAARCGGVVRTSGEAGRASALHVVLPC